MNARQSLLLSLAVFAIAAPGLSSASSLYHPAGGEGFTMHPDHVKSSKTRSEVLQEVEVARENGLLASYQRGAPVQAKMDGPGKTRDQVLQEMQNMSADEKLRVQELYSGS